MAKFMSADKHLTIMYGNDKPIKKIKFIYGFYTTNNQEEIDELREIIKSGRVNIREIPYEEEPEKEVKQTKKKQPTKTKIEVQKKKEEPIKKAIEKRLEDLDIK